MDVLAGVLMGPTLCAAVRRAHTGGKLLTSGGAAPMVRTGSSDDVVGAHMVGGDLEAAGEALEATRVMLARFPTSRQQIALSSSRGRWLVRTGRLDEAILELCDGLDLCETIGRPGERLELLAALVDAHEGRGDLAAALRTLRTLHVATTQQNDRAADRRADLVSSSATPPATRSSTSTTSSV